MYLDSKKIRKKFSQNKIKLITLKTKKLNNLKKKEIFNLKKKYYRYSYLEQKKWFNLNIKKDDSHNLVYCKKILIGYNCLRKISLQKKFNKSKKNKTIVLFDTLIINSQYRGKNYSKLIMKKSNKFIKKTQCPGLLFCVKGMFSYYKKFKWDLLPKQNVKFEKIKDKKLYPMIYNYKNKNLKKIKIIIN